MSDLISRQDAIDALKKYEELESNNFTDTNPISMMAVATIANCIEAIVDLPSAEPEQKKGEWINGNGKDTFIHCSVCGREAYWDTDYGQQEFDFCPYCGADMRGDHE